MKLVAAKCPNCGANIEVDKDSNTTKCEFCNSKIIVDDALVKVKMEITGNVEIENLPKIENILKLANRYYSNKEWDEAHKQYNHAIELDPDNYLIVLRKGICNSLATTDLKFDITPLLNGMKEAFTLIPDNSDTSINQIAEEGYLAINIMENFLKEREVKVFNNLKTLLDNQNKLFLCCDAYQYTVSLARDNELKLKIYNSLINLLEYMNRIKTYHVESPYEMKKIYIPPKSNEKEINSLRNNMVIEYNKLVSESKRLKIKHIPIIRWYYDPAKVIIFSLLGIFSLATILFILFCLSY